MSEKKPNIHAHHRQRLKNRFNSYGYISFEAHNLLELILFYGIPYKDTNPIAHNLIRRFGSVENVLKADKNELVEVSGVGEHAAAFLNFIDFCSDVAVHEGLFSQESRRRYKTVEEVGQMLREALPAYEGGLYAVTFNNNLELIEILRLSGENEPVYKIDREALLSRIIDTKASDAVIAQYKPNGVAIPLFEDMSAVWDLKRDFLSSGVNIAEFFIVTANDCTAVIKNYSAVDKTLHPGFSFAASPTLNEKELPHDHLTPDFLSCADPKKQYPSEEMLARLLSYAIRRGADETAKALISKYKTLYGVLSLDAQTLAAENLSENVCTLLRLTLILKKYLVEKNLTQNLSLTDKRSVLLLLTMMFFGENKENFILLTFDRTKNLTGAHRLGVGTVNSVAIANRMAVEIARDSNASYVIFAHNHPRGTASPSGDDVVMSESLRTAMKNASIELYANYIISNGKYTEI